MKLGAALSFGVALAVAAGCQRDESVARYAPADAYVLQSLNGAPFGADATLSFPGPDGVTGTGPCNAFSAAQTVPYPWIEIGAIRATKRACPDLALETAYFAALRAVTLAEVSGPTLILSNPGGTEMVFQARN
ncbi:Heat shock protein HslJ [Palleronia salina]|uniref:Heat shock protein HslJ n=1 Tax=Palleronia salina TaxID=313368 RepID=A0A1M6JLQ2_9RHOB|nr:META domain-containing protein [Palleronia salina]SHJ47554.1 Heat shock protein HslJ [Palleronia salina]